MSLNYFNENTSLVKSGLLYYDGQHKDSKGNPWNVSAEQIYQIVDNTNEHLQCTDIPVFKEHNKTVDNQVGTITSELEAREITEEDARLNPKLKPLIGKVGIFCDSIEVVDESLIDKIHKGIGKGISIGIDFANNVIRELSFVGLPALAGATVFKSNYNQTMANFNTGITLDEVIQSKEQLEENREQGHQLLDSLFDVINNINELSDEELQGQPREALYEAAIQRFMEMIPESLPMIQSMDYNMYQDQEMMAQGYNQQGQMPQQQMPMRSYARKIDSLSEFMYNPLRRQEPEKKGSLLGTIGKVGLGVAGTGLGLRAGMRGVQAGQRAFQGIGKNAVKGSLGGSIKEGFKSAGKKLLSDIKNPLNTARSAGGQLQRTGQKLLGVSPIKKPKKPAFMNSPQTINID